MPSRKNKKRCVPRHIHIQIVERQKQRGNIESSKKKIPNHVKGKNNMNNDGYLKEIREARRQRNDIFKVLKGRGNKSVYNNSLSGNTIIHKQS